MWSTQDAGSFMFIIEGLAIFGEGVWDVDSEIWLEDSWKENRGKDSEDQ